jgi:D-3-phosphoglycerate dehydrogenase
MKTLFIDCGAQLEKVFRKVHRADDPPVAVNAQSQIQAADLPRLLDGYEICIDDHSYMPTAQIAQCKALRHIVFCGTGASSYMDLPELAGLGITVHTYRGYGDTAVAEHTIALMFACARDIALSDRKVRGGVWGPLEGMQLFGKTLGVIGLGGIGSEVLRIGRGIGMEAIAWNRSPRPGAPLVPLDELLVRSDVISMNLTLNDETRGFLGAAEFARMKPGAIFVNTARAGLPLALDNPLARMGNVTLSAHAAFRTPEASMTLLRRAIDIVRDIVAKTA